MEEARRAQPSITLDELADDMIADDDYPAKEV